MYKSASEYCKRANIGASDGGFNPLKKRYQVAIYQMRATAHSPEKRIYRYLYDYNTKKEAIATLKRRQNSKAEYLYGVAYRIATLERFQEFGDPNAEQEWLDFEAAKKG